MANHVIQQGAAVKKAKKLPKWAVALIVIAVIIALVGGGLLYVFWDVIFSKATNSDLGDYYGLFGYAPITDSEDSDSIYVDYTEHFAQFKDEIEAGMAADATDEEKALAAYIIYRVGCLSNTTAPERAKYTTGGGGATGDIFVGAVDTEAQVGGKMNMTATYYNVLENYNKPTSITKEGIQAFKAQKKTYAALEEYAQIPSGGITASADSLVGIGELMIGALLPFARRSIETPEGKVTWNGDQKSSVITPDGVTGNFKDKPANYDEKTAEQVAAEAVYVRDCDDPTTKWYDDVYGLTADDISTHIITPETIIGSSVVITKEVGSNVEEKDIGFYSVQFSVDTETGRGTKDSATYYAEQLYLANVPQVFMDYLDGFSLVYTKLDVKMTVFENGYFRTWSTDETWAMTGKINQVELDVTLTSDNFSTEAHCYDHDMIMQGFVNRWIGDNASVGQPMSDLPFYEKLKGYTKEAYGTYR